MTLKVSQKGCLNGSAKKVVALQGAKGFWDKARASQRVVARYGGLGSVGAAVGEAVRCKLIYLLLYLLTNYGGTPVGDGVRKF